MTNNDRLAVEAWDIVSQLYIDDLSAETWDSIIDRVNEISDRYEEVVNQVRQASESGTTYRVLSNGMPESWKDDVSLSEAEELYLGHVRLVTILRRYRQFFLTYKALNKTVAFIPPLLTGDIRETEILAKLNIEI